MNLDNLTAVTNPNTVAVAGTAAASNGYDALDRNPGQIYFPPHLGYP